MDNQALTSGAVMTNANRPVRRALAKDKRKLIEQEMGRSNEEDEEEEWEDVDIVKIEKTKQELECITLAVRANFLFSNHVLFRKVLYVEFHLV